MFASQDPRIPGSQGPRVPRSQGPWAPASLRPCGLAPLEARVPVFRVKMCEGRAKASRTQLVTNKLNVLLEIKCAFVSLIMFSYRGIPHRPKCRWSVLQTGLPWLSGFVTSRLKLINRYDILFKGKTVKVELFTDSC